MSNSAYVIATATEVADKNVNGWFEVRFGGFANLPSEKGEKVLSPEFTCFGYQWRLQLYPGGNNISEDGMVAVYLENLSDKSITIQYGFSIKDINEKEVKRHTSLNGFTAKRLLNKPIKIKVYESVHTVAKEELAYTYKFDGNDGYGWPNFWKRSDLVDAHVDMSLVVEVKLKVADGTYQIMANQNAWNLLKNNFGFTFYGGKHFCLPGNENPPAKDSSTVEGMKYFSSLQELRKHLCAYGLPEALKCLSGDESDAIDQWVRYANVVGLGDAPKINLSDVGKPITWREAWGMLKTLGLQYVRAAYRHPHANPSMPPLRFRKKEDFIIHLARFGIPHIDGIQVDKVLDKGDRLRLDLFIASTNVDTL